jgi:hypothetical protein
MTDLPSIKKCPWGPKGRHHMEVILPNKDSGDISLVCGLCFFVRRMPARGGLLYGSLDDLSATEIAKRVAR